MNIQPATISSMAVDLDRAVLAFSDALDFIGVDEVGHAHRVALMAAGCAQVLNWDSARRHRLVQAALLHDCGVSSTREHRALVGNIDWDGAYAHCERGFAYLGAVPCLAHLASIILEHHTPWAELLNRDVDRDTADFANLIYLADRADALHANGVGEGTPIVRILEAHSNLFSPQYLAVFRDVSACEAFWYAQEDPTLRERVAELALAREPISLPMSEVRALAAMFGRIIDAKSPYTERHSQGVAAVSVQLAKHFGIGGLSLQQIELSALLHDIGKLRVPDELLDKQGPLTADERRRMARHAFDTYEILRRVFGDGAVAQWAAFHHEYVSGHGYPFHREAEGLPLEARIIAVADVLQALAQRRPYRQPQTPREITAILEGMVFGGKLDRVVVGEVRAELETYWKAAVASEVEVQAS